MPSEWIIDFAVILKGNPVWKGFCRWKYECTQIHVINEKAKRNFVTNAATIRR